MILKPATGTPRFDAPYFPEVGVLGLVPDDWEGVWQSRHHVLSRLSRYFNVVWVSPARGWREVWLSKQGWKATPPARELPRPSFMVYRPGKLLPTLYKPSFLASLLARARLKQAMRLLVNRGCRRVILYLWRPEYEEALDLVTHDLSCYHIDDEYSFSVVEQPVSESEARLISRVNQLFIHSPALLEKKGHLNRHTQFVPNGVDYQAYATPVDAPADIARVPHPRIGYTGVLKKELDWPLLVELTGRHSDWSFVLVGPTNHQLEIGAFLAQLRGRPNVWFLGPKTAQQLAAYPQHFDVCIMPYRLDSYTNQIYPLKLHEYLAGGRPIVASPIRSLLPFSDVIRLEHTADGWSRALAASLLPAANSTAAEAARRRVAHQHDWEGLVGLIARTMCDGLGRAHSLPRRD